MWAVLHKRKLSSSQIILFGFAGVILIGTLRVGFIKQLKGLLQKVVLQKYLFLKVRNSGRNHEQIVVSTAKILCRFSEKSILQQTLLSLFALHGGMQCIEVRPIVQQIGIYLTIPLKPFKNGSIWWFFA